MRETVKIEEPQLQIFSEQRRSSSFGSCYMTRGLFVRADAKLTCSCMIGYYSELGDLRTTHAGEFCKGKLIRYVAQSFLEGLEPFAMCSCCATRQADEVPEHWRREPCEVKNLTIHVEPSNQCNLFCEACLCTSERKLAGPRLRRTLDFSLYGKMLHELKESEIHVGNVVFAGFGEPLFNNNLSDMVRHARTLYPESHLSLDTNCNFSAEKAREIADCGLDQVRLALDGADQQSYEKYRVKGDFSRAIKFARSLREAVDATGSRTQLVWKYILFRHNDSDLLLHKAAQMAKLYGLRIIFDVSVGPLASQRSLEDLKQSLEGIEVSNNVDQKAYEISSKPKEE